MTKAYVIIALLLIIPSLAVAETAGFHLILGNRDGSTIDVNIDDLIELRVWVATPSFFDLNGDSVQDTINVVYIPSGTNNSVIVSREGGIVYHPFNNWNYEFTDPDSHCQSGYINQSLIASPPLFGWWSPLITYEDTINALSFYMRTSPDSSLIGNTVCPFTAGCDPVNGEVLWGLADGVSPIIPSQAFSCFYFVEYLAGDANRSGAVNGLDVTYMVGYFKGLFPPPDPIYAGDANGDCIVNGVDVMYLVAYFKGGPEPFLGNCH